MACVFCHRSGKSSEHVLPDWLHQAWPDKAPDRHETTLDDTITRAWIQAPFDATTKRVCGKCNTGWMSDLETDVSGFLKPMMLGEKAHRLTVAQQRLTVFWALKTALVMKLLAQGWVMPPVEYDEVYARRKTREPMPGTIAWLGARHSEVLAATMRIHPLTLEINTQGVASETPGYFATLGIGSLVIQVFRPILHGQNLSGGIEISESLAPFLSELWPTTGRPLSWPPARLIDDAMLDLISRLPGES